MMDLNEAIQHCEEVADTPCFTVEEARCYSEHRQLAEWLKELKAYRNKSEIPTSCGDAISRKEALQALCKAVHKNDDNIPCPNQRVSCLWSKTKVQDYAEEILKLPSVTPESCEDAISRQAAIDAVGLCRVPSHIKTRIAELPSVTPQQRTGRWIQKEEEGEAEPFIIWECSECHCVDEDGKPSYKYCPQCGARMEVEE